MIKRSATNPAHGLIDPDAEQAPTRRRRRVNRTGRALSLPTAALILGGLFLSGSLSALSAQTDNAVPLVSQADLSGSVVTSADEAEISAGGETLIITLSNDSWDATVGADNAITTALINGIDSAGAEAAGWDAVVKAGLTFNDVTRTSNTVVTITLPAFGTYNISADETITVTVPATALTGGDALVATPTFDITDIAQNIIFSEATLSGSLATSAFEDWIVDGGETLIITLTNDSWDATVGADNAITTALINGIDSAGAEAAGWDAVVKAGLTFNDVTRISNTVVTITLPAFGTYNITADETITVTVPATALVGGTIVATATFDITDIAQNIIFSEATLSGSVVTSADEAEISAGGETLIITLTNDSWDATVGADNAITAALINGIDSAGAEAAGWDAVVKAGLTFSDVTRTSNTVVTITLPAFGTARLRHLQHHRRRDHHRHRARHRGGRRRPRGHPHLRHHSCPGHHCCPGGSQRQPGHLGRRRTDRRRGRDADHHPRR